MIPKLIKTTGLVLAVIALFLGSASAHEGEEHDAVRIEDDFNLAYPAGQSDEIVEYLKGKYIDDQSFVQGLGAEFTSAYGDEDFTDQYFDTRNLDLYKRKAGLRHRVRVDRSDPAKRKELVQLKLSGEDKLADEASTGSRNEIKFEAAGLAAALQIDEFKAAVSQLELDPYALKPILTIQQHRRRIYLNRDGATFISFSVDDAKAKRWWARAEFSQMEVELNELAYTGASESERERMQEIREGMIVGLRAKFDYLTDDQSIKYTKMFDLLKKRLPFMGFFIKIGIM